eukprot:1449264-Prymnesium_polylepis.1
MNARLVESRCIDDVSAHAIASDSCVLVRFLPKLPSPDTPRPRPRSDLHDIFRFWAREPEPMPDSLGAVGEEVSRACTSVKRGTRSVFSEPLG